MAPTIYLDIASVFIFALSGALVASRAQLDIFGFVFVAALTSVGGGTTRDLLLGRLPVFWMSEPLFIGIAAMAAIMVFFTAHLFENRRHAIVWFDAFALSVAVPAGVGVALDAHQSWSVTLMLGVTTGCMGGLMRDVVCNEVPVVLKAGQPHVTCALIGAGSALIALAMGLRQGMALSLCGAVVGITRCGAIAFGWSIPVYKPRAPRPE